MKIIFITYSFYPNILGGADRYHYELAKQLTANGCSVVVCTKSCDNEAGYFTDGIEVHPLRRKASFMWLADAIITVPSLSLGIPDHYNNVTCIQHTAFKVERYHPHARFIYCAEWLQGMYGKGLVYRPIMRLKEGKERKRGRRIGFVNNARQKGGEMIAKVAAAFPEWDVIVLDFPGDSYEFIKPDLPNVFYWGWNSESDKHMEKFYNSIDIICLPSKTEGFSTVALEALAKGIPAVANNIPGLREPLGEAAWYCETDEDYIKYIKVTYDDYANCTKDAIEQYQVIAKKNNIFELINYIK